ncbi:MAG: dihydrofolate reductase family protein [Vicinamibacterales bacterium]
MGDSVTTGGEAKQAETGRVTLHMVASLDGFIARSDNTVSWLESPPDAYPPGVPEESAADLVRTIDCYVMGSRTYEHAVELGWPYGDTPTIVVTGRQLPSVKANVEYYSGSLETLFNGILRPRYRDIWIVGGAMLCRRVLDRDLVDQIRLTLAPVLLGAGVRLFGDAGSETRWRLRDVVAYNTGFVELVYRRGAA